MRHIFLIFLCGLYVGAFTYSSIAPQHAFAAPHIIYRQVAVTTNYDQSNQPAQIKMIGRQPAKTYVPFEGQGEKRPRTSSGIPWPSINFPDFSFLWKQEHGDQKKNMYDRGQ